LVLKPPNGLLRLLYFGRTEDSGFFDETETVICFGLRVVV
jgi:hypothetical protein